MMELPATIDLDLAKALGTRTLNFGAPGDMVARRRASELQEESRVD